jgi:hypothetical protein
MKKHSIWMATGMAFLFLVAVSLNFSCQPIGKKGAEKAIEQALEQESGENADVDLNANEATITQGDVTSHIDPNANTWPRDIPSEIPEFTYGQIKGVTTTDQPQAYHWTIAFENVPGDGIKKYDAELKAKGFQTIFLDMGSQGGSISCEQGDLVISVMGGDGTVVVGIGKTKPE